MSLLALSLFLTCWTNSDRVTGMVVLGPGHVVASTWGGLLERTPDGVWKKWTTAESLPANELKGVSGSADSLVVETPVGWFRRQSGAWVRTLPMTEGTVAKSPSGNSDSSVMKSHGPKHLDPEFALSNGRVEFIVGQDKDLVLGTAHNGVWEVKNGTWKKVPFNEPSGHDIQALAALDATVFSSTLSDGFDAWNEGQWTQVQGINPPKSIVQYEGSLWALQSDGSVDRLQSGKWTKDVLAGVLPRKQARAMATDGERLFVAQWGGWSVLEKGKWTHDLKRPELAGAITTCLLCDGDQLWIGTQGRGVAVASLVSQKVTWIDERQLLPDDWVTCLAKDSGKTYAGTFVGGLVELDLAKVRVVTGTEGSNVTCLTHHDGALVIGTRGGLGALADGTFKRSNDNSLNAAEVQALFSTGPSLWVGTRAGLYRVGGPVKSVD